MTERHFELPNGHCVLADCDLKTGLLTSSHRYLKRKLFRSADDHFQGYLFLCGCNQGCVQESILSATDPELSEEFLEFYTRETDKHCIHANAAMRLFDMPFGPYQPPCAQPPSDDDAIPCVIPLMDNPVLSAVMMEEKVYLVQTRPRTKKLSCTCVHGVKHTCVHVKAYNEWCIEQGVAAQVDDDSDEVTPRSSTFECMSTKKITVPLSASRQKLYR